MTWLFDLGNTRLKWARWNGSALVDGGALDHSSSDFARTLSQAFTGPDGDLEAYLASVSSAALTEMVENGLRDQGLRLGRIGPPRDRAAGGVRLAYSEPAALGVDRWLGLLAARRLGADVVIASCGSALTLDALNAEGRHLGGLIAPSPECSRAALWQRAPHLKSQPGRAQWFAANTADALEGGSLLAAVALIDRFVAEARKEMAAEPVLLLTGGGANALSSWLTTPAHCEPQLVLQGMLVHLDTAILETLDHDQTGLR